MNVRRLFRWLAVLSLIALPASPSLARRSDPPACPDGSYSCQPICPLASSSCPSPIEILSLRAGEPR